MIIDLRSDTITRPTEGMLEAMMTAEVGDDVFGDDPTVRNLEEKAAKLFGKEAAIFCPSGTMTNQIAVRINTTPGGEVICDKLSHIYNYEGGGMALNSGASVRLVEGDRGRFTAQDVMDNINPDDEHYALTQLVTVENTSNKGGGCCYDLEELRSISKVCKDRGLLLHLDGARVFNALVATGESPADNGALFDTISICLSKGLGAPVGSLLIGSEEKMKAAGRARKAFGGGMRQSGYLAAAGIYAFDHHIERLEEDHQRAKQLGTIIGQLSCVKNVLPVETNIVVFYLNDDIKTDDFIQKLAAKDIIIVPFDEQTIRITTHLGITDNMIDTVEQTLKTIL